MAKSSFYSGTSTPPGQSTPSQSSFYNITSPAGAAAEAAASAAAAAASAAAAAISAGATGAVLYAASQSLSTPQKLQAKTNIGLENVDNTADTAKPVSTAQQTALDLKANLASPAITGNPTAPTQSAGNNSTRLATTAYTDTGLALKANLASPTFTGDPKAPTASPGDNDTSIATTAFVTAAVTAASGAPSLPQGRITLTSGTAVTTNDVTGATTAYYTPATGQYVPIWDGTSAFVMTDIGGELSNVFANTAVGKAGPAAVAADSAYFFLVWNDAGTVRFTRSPAWTNLTTVGSGAGTAEFEVLNGVLVNKVAITNGPAARRGTIVGGFRSDASSQGVDSFLKRFVSNLYNAVPRKMRRTEATANWSYSVAAWRQARAQTANQIAWFHAFDGAPITATVLAAGTTTPDQGFVLGSIGIDASTPVSGVTSSFLQVPGSGLGTSIAAEYEGYAGIGYHEARWLEYCFTMGAGTFYGVTLLQSGIAGETLN